MNDQASLPAEWRATSIGAETEEQSERVGRPIQQPVVLSSTKHQGLIPSDEFFRNRTVYSHNLSNYKRVARNWFAYATNHLAEGSIGLQDKLDEACVSPIYTVFSCRDEVDPSYLFRILKTPELLGRYKLYEQASVDRRGAIRYRDLAGIALVLPPIAEQRRVVELLDTVDENIRSTERFIAKLGQAREGLLGNLLGHRPTETGNFVRWPPHWKAGPAEQFCDKITVGVVNSATGAYAESGVPFIRSQNVRPNRIVLEDVLYITRQFNEIQSKSILRNGDVVIVRTGNPGTAAVISTRLDGANCFSLIICRPKRTLDPYFLACYMNSPVGMALVRRTHFGSAQNNFNIAEMRRLLIPVPPLKEQHNILSIVDSAERELLAEAGRLQKLELLKRGLTKDLLTGGARVPVREGASG